MSNSPCPVCGKPTPSPRATYCSAGCRVKALREKRKAEGLTARGTAPVTGVTAQPDPEALQKAIEDSLSKSAKERLEAATRRRMKNLDWEVEQRATEKANERFTNRLQALRDDVTKLNKRLDRYFDVKIGKPLLPPSEYKVLKMSLAMAGTDEKGKPIRPASEKIVRQALEAWEKLDLKPIEKETWELMERNKKMMDDMMAEHDRKQRAKAK